MKLGTKIKELRSAKGLTQLDLSEQTGLTERTIQRIENHEVEPSKYSLDKIGEVLGVNLNEQKQLLMKRQKTILQIAIWTISILIVVEFLFGVLSWQDDWWILLCWFIPAFSGIAIPYYRRNKA